MATRKNVAEAQEPAEVQVVQTEPAKEPEAPKSNWDIMDVVRVPRKPKGNDYYVCVNDRRFEIPADGKEHEMPRPIAEALQMSLDAEIAAEEFAEKEIPNRSPVQRV